MSIVVGFRNKSHATFIGGLVPKVFHRLQMRYAVVGVTDEPTDGPGRV